MAATTPILMQETALDGRGICDGAYLPICPLSRAEIEESYRQMDRFGVRFVRSRTGVEKPEAELEIRPSKHPLLELQSMKRAKIGVHHFVANLTTRQYGTNPTSDLLGVDYWFVRPPDVELPIRIGLIDLFTRFYLEDASRATFRVELWWNDHEGTPQSRMGSFGPYRVIFRPESTILDQVFRLHEVYLRRPGSHTIRLLRKRRHRWQGPVWVTVRETHFYLELR